MANRSIFDADSITDHKRLARGEHYLSARRLLRVRDEKHNHAWRILILAGGCPSGEVTALRELMPKAHVTAVDKYQSHLDAAIDAGVDEVFQCDLAKFTYQPAISGLTRDTRPLFNSIEEAIEATQNRRRPVYTLGAFPIARQVFDVLSLDFCSNVNPETRKLLEIYSHWHVAKKGVLIFTFSYGRDVVEMFDVALKNWRGTWESRADDAWRLSVARRFIDIPDTIFSRIVYLCGYSMLQMLESVIVYQGSVMPMCSCLFNWNNATRSHKVSFVKVGPGDFELAVCYPESMNLYDCPADRINQLRRSHAAIKASYTKKQPLLDIA